MEVNTVAILGLLLLLSAAGLAVALVLQNTASIGVDALGLDFSLSAGWLFVAGVATGVIGLLGLSMLLAGLTRARRRRAALTESRSSVQGLQAERDRLAVELERERADRTTTVGGRRTDPVKHDDEHDDESAEIDLDDERRSEPAAADYAAVSGGPDRSAARRETAGNSRHGLFHRRH